MYLALQAALFCLGLIILTVGAQLFVKYSVGIAKYWQMPTLVAGVVLVGFGGSFPEIVVSLIAAIHGEANMAIGNAVGSNIVNLGMVLSVSVLLAPITVSPIVLKRDLPLLWLVSLFVFGLLCWLQHLNWVVGIIFMVGLVGYLWLMVLSVKRYKTQQADALGLQMDSCASISIMLFWWVIGLALLFISSELLVASASAIAKYFGMSSLLIGLTVVAIGTSLPEFATTVVSAYKQQHDIALGNVLGSNIFNLLAVLAMPAFFAPQAIVHAVIYRDFPFMLLLTLVVTVAMLVPKNPVRQIGRISATVLLVCWLGYYYLLF